MEDPILTEKDYNEMHKKAQNLGKTGIQTDLLCSGYEFRSKEQEKDLRCFYADNGDYWLKLGPVKTELMNRDPWIVVFRELLFSNECDNVTEFLGPTLNFPPGRMVRSSSTNDWTMKNTWPTEAHNVVLEKFTRRVEHLMDIKANSFKNESDNFMCGNYGIGGHYGTHPDFSDYDEAKFLIPGDRVNRISTVMMVLQAPVAGGATVFPYIGAPVYPEQGSAVAWYNLRSSGVPHQLTRHCACPVLYGQKWIGNKWIGYTPQILNKPCDLKSDAILEGPLPKKNSYDYSFLKNK